MIYCLLFFNLLLNVVILFLLCACLSSSRENTDLLLDVEQNQRRMEKFYFKGKK